MTLLRNNLKQVVHTPLPHSRDTPRGGLRITYQIKSKSNRDMASRRLLRSIGNVLKRDPIGRAVCTKRSDSSDSSEQFARTGPSKCRQELSYCQQIARQLRTQYAEGIYRHKYYTVTLKSRLRVTQGHWKRNHWIDHTRRSK